MDSVGCWGTIADWNVWNRLFDQGTDKLWDNLNKGRQWKDIRHKYVEEE